MVSVINREFKILLSNSRISRLRYTAYSGVLLVTAVSLVLLVSTLHITEATLPVTLLIYGFALAWLVAKYWLIMRRMNDLGRSIISYLKITILGMVFIFLPNIINAASNALGYGAMQGSSIGKIVTAAMYLAGIVMLIYAGIMLLLFRGTAGENKYGQKPAANNYLTVSFSILYLLSIVALNIVVIGQIKKAFNHSQEQQLAESMLASQESEFYMPLLKTNDLNVNDASVIST